jgi:pimeloyl-ACP methyl ester carboxylesterase
MTMQRQLDLKIPLPVGGQFPEPVTMAATIFLPEAVTPGGPVLFLVPGAGYSRGYFDMRPEGFSGYSEADYHVGRGTIVVAMDHLGVGESSLPTDDQLIYPVGEAGGPRFKSPSPFTMQVMGAACDAGVRAALAGLREGRLVEGLGPLEPGAAIGVGQSMGGFVVVMAQANHATFDAVGALGSSFTQTRLARRPGARYPVRNVPPAQLLAAGAGDADMQAAFHWPDEPAALVEADMSPNSDAPWRSRAVPKCASELMLPGVFGREAAAVRVPVFLAYGEEDVTPEPLYDVAAFRSTCDIRLAIIPGMAHMHNFAAPRAHLWRRLDGFVRGVAEGRAMRGGE